MKYTLIFDLVFWLSVYELDIFIYQVYLYIYRYIFIYYNNVSQLIWCNVFGYNSFQIIGHAIILLIGIKQILVIDFEIILVLNKKITHYVWKLFYSPRPHQPSPTKASHSCIRLRFQGYRDRYPPFYQWVVTYEVHFLRRWLAQRPL